MEKIITEKVYSINKQESIISKIRDYVQLGKPRLAVLVVFSAVMGYLIASGGKFEWPEMLLLTLGGFLVTFSSNGFNQIIERDLDKLMTRTATRPLPENRLGVTESMVFCILAGISGIFILGIYLNLLSGILGLLALLWYVLVYTPMKRQTPFAVFAGAVPGAIPPLLGWVAYTGFIGQDAVLLYAIQFIWQFPHFWAIAWVLDDDYKKAGFKMLPSPGGRDKRSAYQTLVYTLCLIPLGLLPVYFHMTGIVSAIVITICGVLFMMQSVDLYRSCSVKSARRLMFGSFIYLPVVQIALVYDKI